MGCIYFKKFSAVRYFLMFIGYPRSGHTLIGALLDAHPNIMIGMEWDAMQYCRLGFRQHQIFYSLIKNSEAFRKVRDNRWTGYNYKVDGMYQGRLRKLTIIGDKFGGRNALWINEEPELLNKLASTLKVPIKIVHVIRNPFDTIATMTRWYKSPKHKKDVTNNLDIVAMIYGYFLRVEVMQELKKDERFDIYDLYHESFIQDPKNNLRKLIDFLEEDPFKEYLEKCSDIVYQKPNMSRHELVWPAELISFVENKIREYDFLRDYSFDN